jgi:hypothetical protein
MDQLLSQSPRLSALYYVRIFLAAERAVQDLPLPQNSYGTVIVQADREGAVVRSYVRRADEDEPLVINAQGKPAYLEYIMAFPGQ